jgi:hypothetical protein
MVEGRAKEVMKDFPIIVNKLSVPDSYVPKETIVEVRTPVENEVREVILLIQGSSRFNPP